MLQYTSYKISSDLKQFIEESLRDLLRDYEHNYGLNEVKEIKECIHTNIETFKKLGDNSIRKILNNILEFIMENQIKDIIQDGKQKDINFLMELFDNISPEDRVYYLNYEESLWSLVKVYEINADEKMECKDNEYTINNMSIICSYDKIINLYKNWLKKKNGNDEMVT